MKKRLRRAWLHVQARLLRHRVSVQGPVRVGPGAAGDVTVYQFRVAGCPIFLSAGPKRNVRLDRGGYPHPPERLQWLRDVCRSWWERGVTVEEFTYHGPPRLPFTVTWRPPTWALPAIADLAERMLVRDHPAQASYIDDGPFR